MAIKEILTDVELVGKGLPARENIQRINENFQELSSGGGESNPVEWDDIENKPNLATVEQLALKLNIPATATSAVLVRGDGSTVTASTYATAANLTSGLAGKMNVPATATSAVLVRGDGSTVASNTFATAAQGTLATNAVPKKTITELAAGETDLATIVAKINEIIASLK